MERLMKKIIWFSACCLILMTLIVSSDYGHADDSSKNLYYGISAGFGTGQPLVPDEFSGMFAANPKPEFSYDVSATLAYYFNSVLGINISVGYDNLSFTLEGDGDLSGFTANVLPTGGLEEFAALPGFSTTSLTYNRFRGHVGIKVHYLSLKVGPSFRFGGFFLNVNAALVLNIAASYTFTAGTIDTPIGPMNMPEMAGDYTDVMPLAVGALVEPGYRIRLGGYTIPVSVGVRFMITPIGEADIYGTSLPDANIYTWIVKARIGFEF